MAVSCAREAAFTALSKIGRSGAYSNIVLSELYDGEMSQKDALLALKIVKTVLERKYTLDYNIARCLSKKLNKTRPDVLTILRIGAAQLLFFDRVPDSAAVSESVELAKKHGCAFAAGFVNAVLREIAHCGLRLPEKKDYIHYLNVKYSFPAYVCAGFVKSYGKTKAQKIMESMFGESNIYIRKNSLKSEPLSVYAEECPGWEFCYTLENSFGMQNTLDYKKGLFHVQDLSSQLCCRVLAPKPGETVLDICASPGGKSATAAQMMNNEGRIIACDIHKSRLKLIEENAERLGITIIETRERDGTDENALLPEADRILCDVPCSGFGAAGKKPEIRYKQESEIKSLPSLQLSILENSARFLKKDGLLVYSTCTLWEKENNGVAREFLRRHREFVPVHIDDSIKGLRQGETLTVMPYDYDCDGFFIAAFKRVE